MSYKLLTSITPLSPNASFRLFFPAPLWHFCTTFAKTRLITITRALIDGICQSHDTLYGTSDV